MLQQALRKYPLSKSVRYGQCGTCPKTLTKFLSACEDACEKLSAQQARQVQIDVFEILLDTICDCMIAKCWRGWCLDNAHRPLRNIRLLSSTTAEKAQLANLEAQMRTLSYYFLN